MVFSDNSAVLRLNKLDKGFRPNAPMTTNTSFLPSK